MAELNYYNINLSQLMYFISAARHLNFSKAAEECHVVPNVISKQMANIQSKLGKPLFYKDGKKMYLTEAGQLLYRYAQNTVDQLYASIREINKYDSSINMELRIGYYDIWSKSFIPPIVRDFRKQYPYATVIIKYFNLTQLVPRLSSGIIDVLFVAPFRKIKGENLDSFVLDTSPVNLIVPDKHPLSFCDEISLDQFTKLKDEYFPYFNFTGEDRGNPAELSVDKHNLVNSINLYPLLGLEESHNVDNILFSVRSEMGLGFLPEAARSNYTDKLGIKFIKIKGNLAPINMNVIWNRNNRNEAMPLFLEVAKKHVSDTVQKGGTS